MLGAKETIEIENHPALSFAFVVWIRFHQVVGDGFCDDLTDLSVVWAACEIGPVHEPVPIIHRDGDARDARIVRGARQESHGVRELRDCVEESEHVLTVAGASWDFFPQVFGGVSQ